MLNGVFIVLVTLVALLLIPLAIEFRLDWPERRNRDVRFTWLFGLVEVRAPRGDNDQPATPVDDDAQKQRPAKRRRGNPLAAIRNRPFRQRLLRFVNAIWRAVGKEDVFVDVTLGLGDPADTGRLWAWVGPVSGVLARAPSARVNLMPDFGAQRIDVDTGGRLRVVPLRIIGLAAGLALSPAFWRGMHLAKHGP